MMRLAGMDQIINLVTIGIVSTTLISTPMSARAANGPVWGADDGFRPYDVQREIREYFSRRLPLGWFVGNPEARDGLGTYQVRLNISKEWGGNPVSAAKNLCPDRYNLMWQYITGLVIMPFYHGTSWAPVECY